MSRTASHPGALLAAATLAGAAAWVTFVAWRVLTDGFADVAFSLLLVAVTTACLGTLGRWRGWPIPAVLLAQVVVAWLFVLASATGSLVPSPANVEAWWASLQAAVEAARAHPAPVPANGSSVHPLLLLAGVGMVVAADLLVALRRAPLIGLVLLAAYATPLAITGRGVSWWVFVAGAGAWLAVIVVQHVERIDAWGWRTSGADHDHHSPRPLRAGRLGAVAFSMGAVALALALAAPQAMPTMGVTLFRGGSGAGGGPVEVVNPMVDLRRDLSRGIDIPLLTVTTEAERPSYLRLSVLTRFLDGRWTPGDREIPEDQTATGELPGLEGASLRLPRRQSDYRIQVTDAFDSTWLPTAAHVTNINAGEEWRYDLSTRDFIAVADATTAGMDYGFSAVSLEYDPELMDNAVSGETAVRPIFSEVPPDLSEEIEDLAEEVTAGAPTRFQKAQLLQRWFREDGGFRYDLAQAESLGRGHADLNAFLLDEENGRVGYCEQFAASMAIMARTLDIPARVAVGFLQPELVSRGVWEYSAWDMHAWPELYFPGAGWVRFEPTPGDRASQTPGYSTAQIQEEQPESTPSARPTNTRVPEQSEAIAPEVTDEPEVESRVSPTVVLLGAAGLLAVLAILFGPRVLRSRRRRRHLGGGPEDVWRELRSTVVDLGHPWPAGRSPRRTGHQIGQLLAALPEPGREPTRWRKGRDQAPEAAAALDRLVATLERHRYSRTGADAQGEHLVSDLEAVEESLRAGVAPQVRRQAAWFPKSLTKRDTRRTPRRGASTEESALEVDRLVR